MALTDQSCPFFMPNTNFFHKNYYGQPLLTPPQEPVQTFYFNKTGVFRWPLRPSLDSVHTFVVFFLKASLTYANQQYLRQQVWGTTRCVKSHLVLDKNEITFLWCNWEKVLRNCWNALDLSEICLKYVRDLPEICLKYAWEVTEIYQRYVWYLVSGWYITDICLI